MNADLIPIDLMIEIFSRLSVKSIARCRCVSKLCSSILAHTDFTELVLAKSVARPKLLYVNNDLIFSSPQPQNPDENSSPIVADYHMSFQDIYLHLLKVDYANGLICFTTMRFLEEHHCIVLGIYNPSTGQSLTLPRVKTNKVNVHSFLGYDPIDKQFKLLSMTGPYIGINWSGCGEHQVMTLGETGELLWRIVECRTPHSFISNGICINGVLYYLAWIRKGPAESFVIACFDIRSEKFKFIEDTQLVREKLVNYKGKLATLKTDDGRITVSATTRSFELCVLKDAEKHEWTKHTYVLPPLWKDIVANDRLSIVGVTKTGEIVFTPYHPHGPIYFIYYNLERNTVVKVETQGLDGFERRYVNVFLDHVEDVKLGGGCLVHHNSKTLKHSYLSLSQEVLRQEWLFYNEFFTLYILLSDTLDFSSSNKLWVCFC